MAETNETMKDIARIQGGDAQRMVLPVDDMEEVDLSGADPVVPTMKNCRCISVDVDGIIKIDHTRDSDGATITEVLQVNAGSFMPLRNVIKAYPHYVGTTDCTAQYYTSAGTLKVGLKLRR